MPKGKKEKNPKGRHAGRVVPDDLSSEFDDRDSIADLESVTSNVSDATSLNDSEKEQEEFEALEEKMKEAIDGLYEKSTQGRAGFLQFLLKTFQSRLVTEFLMERYETLTDSMERCLRKGRAPEQGAAASLAAATLLQLGDEGSLFLFNALHPLLISLLNDKSVPSSARAKVAESLGLLTFVCGDNVDAFKATMKGLESVFGLAYPRGCGTAGANLTPETFALIGAALSSWTLLVSLLPAPQAESVIDKHLARLPGLLDSTDLDVRIACGEAIALVYEILREQDEEFEIEAHDDLCDKLRLLATDSQRFRAKKDRKQQRSSFREILRTVEENDYPLETIKFGREVLQLDCWLKKLQYDSFCNVLGPGTNFHLASNELIRDIFGLGAVIPTDANRLLKQSKMDRHLSNVATFKARTKARNKTRDKRAYDGEEY